MSTSTPNLTLEDPELYKAAASSAREAEAAAIKAGLDRGFVELVKVRVSQMNGCAFCLRVHSADWLKEGESPDRLAVLSAWRETSYFDQTEQAALELAETTSDISHHRRGKHEPDAGTILTKEQASAVVWLSIAMNTFNRVALKSGHRVAPPAGGAHLG